MKKLMTTWVMAILLAGGLRADIKVSDVEVFSGYPWKEVVIAYTITGTDESAHFILLTAIDKVANKTYTAKTLTGAGLSEGRHLMRWDATADSAKFSSTNVVFTVLVFSGVQLWENGPYWAECNVGAGKPEEYGYYFWWGDTVGYERNSSNSGWISAQKGLSFYFSSYCPTYNRTNSKLYSLGYIDSGTLNSAHDAATQYLGAPWRMPTRAEFEALLSKCNNTWTTRNGVYGHLITGRGTYSSKSIFLPAAGYGFDSSLSSVGSSGRYLSSSPTSDNSYGAWGIESDAGYIGLHSNCRRDFGQSVRPVRGAVQ